MEDNFKSKVYILWRQCEKHKEENNVLFYHQGISTVVILIYAFSTCVCMCTHVHRIYQVYLDSISPKFGADTIRGIWDIVENIWMSIFH